MNGEGKWSAACSSLLFACWHMAVLWFGVVVRCCSYPVDDQEGVFICHSNSVLHLKFLESVLCLSGWKCMAHNKLHLNVKSAFHISSLKKIFFFKLWVFICILNDECKPFACYPCECLIIALFKLVMNMINYIFQCKKKHYISILPVL